MKSQFKYLAICVISTTLIACGGGDNNGNGNIGSNSSNEKFSEPQTNVFDDDVIGFYDSDKDNNERTIRNDLIGNFEAMIQFAQNHTVDPSGNEAKNMPRLTSEKDALLLVTPTKEMGVTQKIAVEVYQDNRLLRTIALNDPTQIPSSDQNNSDERARVQYSKRTWSAKLDWNEIKPGLSLRIIESISGKSGQLNADDIEFAAPGELVVQNIRLGLLTDPPKSTNHYMLLEPEKAGTDYFQTIPAAKMVVSRYDDMTLSKVMVANGTIYDDKSATNGDVYSGDMRENTAKSTFSTGINLANWGITSAGMQSQEQPQLTQSVVVHHARGKYQNGDSTHGLSGGNGILTLYDSVGNEFSHEIGHHYGLGHYPGQVGENQFWAAHHHDSGWGYVSYRNRMRGNLFWSVKWFWGENTQIPRFHNLYTFTRDSMSGGDHSSAISRYVHYTGYSTKIKIQPAFDRAMWDASSPTGYKKWNATTRQMEVFQPKTPKSDQVWYNSADGIYLKPKQFGVQVFTILGGYDPVAQVGLLYPAARGNWGNVFNLPQANTTGSAATCWINVKFVNKSEENIALSPNRMGSNANKLHINLAQNDRPRSVDLYCKKENEQAKKLSSIDIPSYEQPLPDAVIIGKNSGYNAIKRVELPELEQALLNNTSNSISSLTPNQKVLFESYKDFKNELSLTAQVEMDRYSEQQNKLFRLNRWVNVYRNELTSGNLEAEQAFNAFVDQKLGLENDIPLANAEMLVMPNMNSACLKVETNNEGKKSIFMSGKDGCTGETDTLWIYDAVGKIHSAKYPELCLSGASLSTCNNESNEQIWNTSVTGSTQQFHQGNQCLDLSGGKSPSPDGRGSIIMYSCSGGNNQKWSLIPKSNSFILAAASGRNLSLISKLRIQKENDNTLK